MSSLNELRLRPAASLETRTPKGGVRLLKQLDRAEYLALDETEQKIFDRFDGHRTVQEVLHSLLLEGARPRLRSFYQFVVTAFDKGFLVEEDEEPAPCGPLVRRWALGWGGIPAGVLPVAAVALGAPAAWSAGRSLPLTPEGWMEALAAFVLSMSLANALAACVLAGFGRQVYRVFRPLWFAVDSRDAFMGGRLCEAGVALQRIAAPFLLALPAWALDAAPVTFGCALAALVLTSPFGDTPAHGLIFALLRRRPGSPRSGATFLNTRVVAQIFDWREKLTEDRYCLVYCTYAIGWLGAFFGFASRLFQQQGALLAADFAGATGGVGRWLALAGLVLAGAAVAAPVGYLFWIVLKGATRLVGPRFFFAESALPRRRSAGAPSVRQIREFLGGTLLLSQLSPEARDAVVTAMRFVAVRDGTPIVREREPGDALFVVYEGEVKVSRETEAGESEEVARLGRGDVFGEIALLDRVPRTSTVCARGPVSLLALDRVDFERLLVSFLGAGAIRNTIQVSAFLRRNPLFADWNPVALLRLSQEFAFQSVKEGEAVIREGHSNASFFIVYEGRFEVRKQGAACATLGPGDFCGEISLLRDVPATADVTALGDGRCLRLSKEKFLPFVSQHFLTGLTLERALESRLGEREGA